ncbi:MAG: helix-turn-helix domain-containing protein [Nitrospirota bacterium]
MALDVIDVRNVANILNVSSITIYRLAKRGKIPARKVGRCWRFNRDTIAAWLAGNTWEEQLDAFLTKIWAMTENIPSEKVEEEVELAIKEVRALKK